MTLNLAFKFFAFGCLKFFVYTFDLFGALYSHLVLFHENDKTLNMLCIIVLEMNFFRSFQFVQMSDIKHYSCSLKLHVFPIAGIHSNVAISSFSFVFASRSFVFDSHSCLNANILYIPWTPSMLKFKYHPIKSLYGAYCVILMINEMRSDIIQSHTK